MDIICAEALWEDDTSSRRQSYEKLLHLIGMEAGCRVGYFTFLTPEELREIIRVGSSDGYKIIYIASHMSNGNIEYGYKRKNRFPYRQLLESVQDNLKGKVLHLSGCSSLNNKNFPNAVDFVKVSGLRALSGYHIDTYTTESSAMDLIYLTTISMFGIDGFKDNLIHRYKQLSEITGFGLIDGKEV